MSESGSLKTNLREAAELFRWGTAATAVTIVLASLLGLALIAPNLAREIISIFLLISGSLVAMATIIMVIPDIRYGLLKLLLRWRQWAYMPRSSITAVYLALTRILGGSKPKLWQLQPLLPPLPVPPLEQTLKKYLDSVEHLLTPEEFEETKKAVEEFKSSGVGPKLQALLEERAKTHIETNWLHEWWENFVYLKSRLPLVIYSNWYGLDKIDPVIRNQTARTANLINGCLKFKSMIDTQSLEPNRVQETVPLCMWQYSRIFGTTRIPGVEIDSFSFNPKSKHIVVIYKDRFFKLDVYEDNVPLPTRDIQA